MQNQTLLVQGLGEIGIKLVSSQSHVISFENETGKIINTNNESR